MKLFTHLGKTATVCALVFVLVFSLVGCGGSDNGGSSDNGPATIEPTVIWEASGVSVTAESLGVDDYNYPVISLSVTNDSDTDINLDCEWLAVNNYMMFVNCSIDVAAGSSATGDIALYRDLYDASGIETMAELEFVLDLYDASTYDLLDYSDPITIKTSAYGKVNQPDITDGVEVFDQDNIYISALYFDGDDSSSYLYFYIENNTDQNLSFWSADFTVNGAEVSALLSEDVRAGARCVTYVNILDAEYNGIPLDSIEAMTFSFDVYDTDTYDDYLSTGTLDISH